MSIHTTAAATRSKYGENKIFRVLVLFAVDYRGDMIVILRNWFTNEYGDMQYQDFKFYSIF